jgi:predicted unusual protein kinase regulating ubiquinone biosynthesis (AarF/ABC1/UbiB family)
VREMVERELGRPLAEVFASFEETPFSAASVGQVHRATLHNGRQVAVKVRRATLAHPCRRPNPNPSTHSAGMRCGCVC